MKKALSLLLCLLLLIAPLSLIGNAAEEKAVKFEITENTGAIYKSIELGDDSFTLAAGMTFNYDVYIVDDASGLGQLNLAIHNTGNPVIADQRDAGQNGVGILDTNGAGSHPKVDLTEEYTVGEWHTRTFEIAASYPDGEYTDLFVGEVVALFFASEPTKDNENNIIDGTGEGTAYYKNINVKAADGSVVWSFDLSKELTFVNGPAVTEGSAYTIGAVDVPDSIALPHMTLLENAPSADAVKVAFGTGLTEDTAKGQYVTHRDNDSYVYLKEGTDPVFTNKFTVDEAGKYDLAIELLPLSAGTMRTTIVAIDGVEYYLGAKHAEISDGSEWWGGITANLTEGEHTVTLTLADDFDNSTVKSLYIRSYAYTLVEPAVDDDVTTNDDVTTGDNDDDAPQTGDATVAAVAIAAVASLGAVLVIGKKRS